MSLANNIGEFCLERATTTHIYHRRQSNEEDRERTGSQNEAGRTRVSTAVLFDFEDWIFWARDEASFSFSMFWPLNSVSYMEFCGVGWTSFSGHLRRYRHVSSNTTGDQSGYACGHFFLRNIEITTCHVYHITPLRLHFRRKTR